MGFNYYSRPTYNNINDNILEQFRPSASKSLLRKIKEYTELVKKNNAKFKKLTKAQKRVDIAKDVISQIKAKRFIPEHTGYVTTRKSNFNYGDAFVPAGTQLGADAIGNKCDVCALGSMFVSCLEKRNNLTNNEVSHVENVPQRVIVN